LSGAVGGTALVHTFAGVMAVGAVASALAFPSPRPLPVDAAPDGAALPALPKVVWFGVAGIASMTLVQAMTFSFLENVGIHRGFTQQAINGVLIAIGFVNLLPAALAALLEKRLAARRVVLIRSEERRVGKG